jgi:hypothetical protein
MDERKPVELSNPSPPRLRREYRGDTRSQEAKITVLNALPGGCSDAQTTHNTMTNHITPHWNKNDFTQDHENIHPRTKTTTKTKIYISIPEQDMTKLPSPHYKKLSI